MKSKSIAAIFLGLVLLAPGLAQQHAPLLATCEADLALWYSSEAFIEYNNAETVNFLDGTSNKTPLNRLSIEEVVARHKEMGDCWLMTHRNIYHDADQSYMGIFHDRQHNFIVRHNLMDQFKAEDAQGKR